MIDPEKDESLLRASVELLMQSTSNSLHPEDRAAWAHRRDELVEEIKVALS